MTRTLRLAAHLLLGAGLLAVALDPVRAQDDGKKDKDKKDVRRVLPGDEYRQAVRRHLQGSPASHGRGCPARQSA